MRVRSTIVSTLLAVAWVAAPAQAQWMVTPYLGINVAGDLEERRGGAGISAGYVGGRVGFELDVERHGHFFEDAAIGNAGSQQREDVNTRATRIMGDVLVPLHRGASGWRPYAAAGFGVIRAELIHEGPGPDVRQTDPALAAGGGVVKWLGSRLGLRADLRYFRAFADQEKPLPAGQIGDLNGVYRDYAFWQFTLGVTFGSRDD